MGKTRKIRALLAFSSSQSSITFFRCSYKQFVFCATEGGKMGLWQSKAKDSSLIMPTLWKHSFKHSSFFVCLFVPLYSSAWTALHSLSDDVGRLGTFLEKVYDQICWWQYLCDNGIRNILENKEILQKEPENKRFFFWKVIFIPWVQNKRLDECWSIKLVKILIYLLLGFVENLERSEMLVKTKEKVTKRMSANLNGVAHLTINEML